MWAYEIFIPIAIVVGIGLVLGLVLAVAAIILHVPVDERVEAVTEVLPGANCGACGYSGCSGYASALCEGCAENGLCAPGGPEVVQKISELLGGGAVTLVPKVAMVHCNGTPEHTSQKMDYKGIPSCAAASMMSGGTQTCQYGCLGFGDCVNVCEYDAIHIVNGVAVVNPEKCTACTMCVKECPKNLIRLVTLKEQAVVRCNSQDKGNITNKACKVGCIACMKCVKACEYDAIKIENFRAIIDPDKCTACGACVDVCPKDCITLYSSEPRRMQA